MITVPLRDLRNDFAKLEAWLQEGESIQIKKRGKLIALLTGVTTRKKTQSHKPDFAARRRATWKGRVFTPREVTSMRNDELGEMS